MQTSLQAYLGKEIPASEFAIHYHIGDDFSGETDFQLRGDGTYTLWSTATEGRQRKNFAGQVTTSQVEAVVRQMVTARVWEARHVHPRPGEDDPEAFITVEASGQRHQVVLWVSEIKSVPSFAEAQRGLLALIYAVSEGQVLEAGQ